MRVSGTKQRQIQGGMVGRKQRSPLSPRRPSHVSVAADLPPDLSSNAFDALRAARADDRLYVPLCLNRLERVINTSGSSARMGRTYGKQSSKFLLKYTITSIPLHWIQEYPREY